MNAQVKETGQTALMLLLKRNDNYYPSEAFQEKAIENIKAINVLVDHKDIDLSIEDDMRCSALDYAKYSASGNRFNAGSRFSYSIVRRIEEKLNNQKTDSRTYNLSQRISSERDM